MAAETELGHAGAVSALSVVEVLEMQWTNRFSGSVTFVNEGQQATVYFQHGELVHAEAGLRKGEPALRAIAGWPTGGVEAHANVSTFARSIDERSGRELLESLRIEASRRSAGAPTPLPGAAPGATPPPAVRRGSPTAAEKARAVPGVCYATVLRGGAVVNDADPRADALATRSAYLLSKVANPLSKALGLGDLSRGALSSLEGEQLLLFHSQDAYLAVSVVAGAPLQETEAGIRRALGTKAG